MKPSDSVSQSSRWIWSVLPALLLGVLPAAAQSPTTEGQVDARASVAPTFSRDVAPILQTKCQQCHQPGGMAPMSLITYEEVRPWTAVIKDRVTRRVMPPWHLDTTVGIQNYENDPSLSDEQIRTISAWVEGGAPQGNPADMPAPLDLASHGEWQLAEQLGPPDVIIKSSPYTVAPDGMDQWWRPDVPFEGINEERWLMAAEFKPAYPLGQQVVHHGHANFIQEGMGTRGIARYGVGKTWEIFPENVGMLIKPGAAMVNWDLHYFPSGELVENDVVEAGLWFYEKGQEPEHETRGEVMILVDKSEERPRGVDIIIPPHSYQTLQGVHVIQRPTVVHSFRPHMHMRGKEMSMEAIYPDGRREILSKVDKYDHFWQLSYQYGVEARPLLPVGTVLLFTAVFDNTADNPINPDPNQWVAFGQRGVDEMSHAWVGMTYVDEETFGEMVAARTGQAQQVAGNN